MQYKLIVEKKVTKKLKKLPSDYYKLVMRHIFSLKDNPRPFGYIKLEGGKDTYRIRVGVYRVIYTIKDYILTVNVVGVDHRSSVYD